MKPKNKTLVRISALVASFAVIGGGLAPVATGQVPGVKPGDDRDTYVVGTGDGRISVAVSTPNVTAGTVLVTVQNNTGGNLQCAGFDGGATVTVAPDEVISRTLDHYSRYAVYPDPTITTEPIRVGIIPGLDAMTFPLGSVTDMIPSAMARHIWPEAGSRSVIASQYDDARMTGRTGRHTGSITVLGNSSTSVTVPLVDASRGTRAQFNAGAVVGCTFSGINYVYAGYSPETPPQGTTGSLSLPTVGRFGS